MGTLNTKAIRIAYKKRHLNINLILGLVWAAYFFVSTLTKERLHWSTYGWLVLSIAYLGLNLYQRHQKYLTLKNGELKEKF